MPENVRDINSARPYHTAHEYFEKGWLGPLPIEPDKKYGNIPLHHTGRRAKDNQVTVQKINKWIKERKNNSNIGLHMADVTIGKKIYQIIGLDVDHYDEIDSDGVVKHKRGGDQLKRLERQLGKLPHTWISTSRIDGISGIRFFLVEKKGAGYLFKGKASQHIDVIQFIHRYAVVYPSKHPTTGRWYRWTNDFPIKLGTDTREPIVFHPIPNVEDLPMLPEAWIKELTNNYVEYEDVPMETDMSASQLESWAKRRYIDAEGPMCSFVEKALERWKKNIEEDASSHDKIRDAHWEILSLGSPLEGHSGALLAAREIQNYWAHDVGPVRLKRTQDEIDIEIKRSRWNALRKIKGLINEREEELEKKIRAVRCPCFNEEEFTLSKGAPKPTGKAEEPLDYPPDHDGTAQHFNDLYEGDVHWVESEKSWYVWDGNRWQRDATGLRYRMLWVVRDRIRSHAHNQNLSLTAQGKPDPAQDEKGAEVWQGKKDKATNFVKWGKNLGMKTHREASIDCVAAIEHVSVRKEVFDQNRHLLGVANGVVELDLETGKFHLRDGKREDMITYSTGIPYIPLSKLIADEDPGWEMFKNYMDTFLPDGDKRQAIRTCLAASLYGENIDKKMFFCIGETNTGKSTLLELVSECMGEYSGPPGMGIYEKKESGLTPALTRAFARRFVISSEVEENTNMDASRLKELTGGDKLPSENKNSNVVIEDYVAFTMWMASNSAPSINNMDSATRGRIIAFPFTNPVVGDDLHGKAMSLLKRHAKMVCLAWMIEAWPLYCSMNTLNLGKMPQEVQDATNLFFTEMSPVGVWAQENLAEKRGHFEYPTDLYSKYAAYARNVMRVPENKLLDEGRFTKEMAAMGWKKDVRRIKGQKPQRVWVGVEYTGLSGTKFRGRNV